MTHQEDVKMLVNWIGDVDEAFAIAGSQKRPILLDFSAAPT